MSGEPPALPSSLGAASADVADDAEASADAEAEAEADNDAEAAISCIELCGGSVCTGAGAGAGASVGMGDGACV